MPDIKAVIFDMYETLAHNNTSLWPPAFEQICKDQGLPLTGQQLWDIWKPVELDFRKGRNQAGNSGDIPPFKTYEHAWRDCFTHVFRQIGKGDAADAARRCVIALGQRELFPDTLNIIARLRSANLFRLGVLSNADNDSLWPLLRRHGLEFDGVVTSEAARAYKPHPRPFQLIAKAMGVSAEACLFVGDQQYDDVQGAHAVGMQTLWVNRGGAPIDPHWAAPDHQVKDLAGVLDILGVHGSGLIEFSSQE
ncbi:MAG: HAD family hydrolase [Dehalococcoidia bacterium]|nr:HAD family hydrolase [Dehalococcoidia bacterium]